MSLSALPWTQYTEAVVGLNHPTLPDTDNRALRALVSQSGYNPDAAPFAGLYGPVFNIKAYGGVGDFTTDNTPALTAALAAVTAVGGGIIFFPRGGYNFNTSPTLAGITDVAFVGAGQNATLLLMGQSGVTVLGFTGVCSRIIIRDLFLGATASYATGGGISIVGTVGVHSDTFLVENVIVQNAPNPVALQYLDNSNFRNLRITQTISGAVKGVALTMNTVISTTFTELLAFCPSGTFPSDGVRVDYDCDTIIFDNSQSLAATGYCWRIMQSAGSTGPRLARFTNCYGESSLTGGWSIEAARDVRLSGCHAAINAGNGFTVSGGTGITIRNSLAFQNQQHGIYVPGGAGVLIEGNLCSNNSQQTNNVYDGIAIGTTDCRVTGNRSGDIILSLANKQAHGLNLTAATDFLTVGGNKLEGNLGAGFEQPILNNSTGANNEFYGSRFVAASEALVVAGVDTQSRATVYIEVTLTAARLVGAMFSPFKGQRLTLTFIQSGAGGFAVTWNAQFKVTWSDAGNTTPKRSSVSFVYDGTNYNQDGAQTPYV